MKNKLKILAISIATITISCISFHLVKNGYLI